MNEHIDLDCRLTIDTTEDLKKAEWIMNRLDVNCNDIDSAMQAINLAGQYSQKRPKI